MRRFALLGVLLLLGLTVATAGAAEQTATDSFYGTATTGAGQPLPVDINPADVKVRSDGAIGLGYVYRAEGTATGDVPGTFVYVERGYLYFLNPADPTTFAGSEYLGGVFMLTPRSGSPAISIADTNPAAYTSGMVTTTVSSLKGSMANLARVMGSIGGLQGGGTLTYGYFTFTDRYGVRTGYATPDSRTFTIAIEFDR